MEPKDVALEHSHSDLADEGHVLNARVKRRLINVLVRGDVDDDGAVLDPLRVHLVIWGRHAEHDDVGAAHRLLHAVRRLRHYAAAHDVDGVDVHGVDLGAVVGQQRRQGPAHDLGPVNHGRRYAAELVPHGQVAVVEPEAIDRLHHGEGRAGQDVLGAVAGDPDVAVHGGAGGCAEPLGILLRRNAVAEVLIHGVAEERRARAEDGVVYDDAADGVLFVGAQQRRFELDGRNLAQLVLDAVGLAGAPRPVRVLPRRIVRVRQKAAELRPLIFLRQRRCAVLDLVAERRGHVGRLHPNHPQP
mmetsp:Transcript_14689/g.44146  ORF Transcript_14689/g.44146 Transcript_14689/m.44146 type:complete len:301 (-) Transcript_14689:46-948(-)